MRGILLSILVVCAAPLCFGGEEAVTATASSAPVPVEPLSPEDAMELLLREAVSDADAGLAGRARVSVNLLVYSGQTSFGSVLVYRDEAVGLENYTADSALVRNEMMKLVEDDGRLAICCLAWHFRKGAGRYYGGATYGSEGGRGAIDFLKSAVPVEENE